VRPDDSIDLRAAAFAAVASFGLHLLLLWLLPDTFRQAVVAIVRPVEVLTAPVKIDEARLPPKLRFAETNPLANQAVPKTAPFTSARNQTAAQPVPEKMPSNSALPKSAGTSPEIRLIQARPRSIDQSQAQPTPAPAISMAAPTPVTTPAPPPGPGKAAAKPVPKAAPAPRPVDPERPRASIPSGTAGLLLRNSVGVNRAGAVAIDARFSQYGDYTQRMLEAIQSSWWSIIERSQFESIQRGRVTVRFRLHRDGTVTDAVILSHEVTRVMSLACKDAVMAPAPYDIWRADMVALYGESDMVTINFYYR
jgi:outer membrane biosynthesis protein TonB